MQIAIKPAKPFAFGTLRHAGVRAARQPGELAGQLRAAHPPRAAPDDGSPAARPPGLVAVSDEGIPAGRTARCTFRVNTAFGDDGRFRVTPVGAQGSHQLAATALADASPIVPDGDGIPPGG